MNNPCQIQWLGRMDFGAASRLQRDLTARRAVDDIPDTLLLMEHPHTYTIGLGGHPEQLLTNPAELSRLNITCYRVDRSGGLTYHGPGQLVAYAILNLRQSGLNYHAYLELLESVIIKALRQFKVHAFRQPGQRGVWVLPSYAPYYTPRWMETDDHIARIGIVGIKVAPDHITSHGFAINVAPNLDYFDQIVPRGIQGCKVTSLQQVLNKRLEVGTFIEPVIQSFCELFKLDPLLYDMPVTTKTAQASAARDLVPS
jgi:lipoate-protein ligase B